MCCDSAHKTLPALTGAAYLHIGKGAPALFAREARQAMALFGSTSPSYLIMASLDECNRILNNDYHEQLSKFCRVLDFGRDTLREKGWRVENADMTILAQKPKLMPHIPQMRQNLSRVMGVPVTAISVKATTEEGLGFTGSGEGIAAHCVCLLN